MTAVDNTTARLAPLAPILRSTFTRSDRHEEWAHPCPPWCTREGAHHEAHAAMLGGRRHRSASLRVRQDAGPSYDDKVGTKREGARAAHLEVQLDACSRDLQPRVRIVARYGVDGEPGAFSLAPLYPDEVRELVAVLQHFLRVAQAD